MFFFAVRIYVGNGLFLMLLFPYPSRNELTREAIKGESFKKNFNAQRNVAQD
jgi:hypothetical protein